MTEARGASGSTPSAVSLLATAALGTEDLVAGELRALGFAGVRRRTGGVEFEAADPLESGMRACLYLRAALRVLWPLASFPVADADALYEGAAAVAWEDWLATDRTFAVAATTRAAPPLAHGPFVAQRVKDAIVDRLRARRGARPDVSREAPDVQVYVHVAPGRATVGLDLAGESLHLRGYRVASTPAPLRETMAAAVLLASGWRADQPLADPMCGSGTIAIEAALLACRVAPGRAARRPRRFGFERWPAFGDAAAATWRRLGEQADAAALPRSPVPIVGADHDPRAIEAARRNAAAAAPPIAASIEWRVADARALAPLEPPGVIVSNPPYGERLGRPGKALEGFWRALGAHLRTLDGHVAFLLSASDAMSRAFGMRSTWQRKLMNGPIAVTLGRYELGRRRPRGR